MPPSIQFNPAAAANRRSRAFTLLELMLSLSILALLAGALFATVQASMQAAASLVLAQNQHRQITGFIDLCRRTLQTLPPDAGLELRKVSMEGRDISELILREAPLAFSWSEQAVHYGPIVLGARPQPGGLVTAALLRDGIDDATNYVSGRGNTPQDWLRLLEDLRTLEWRFYDARTATWMEEWRETTVRPAQVELTLEIAGEAEPHVMVFWIPPIVRPTQQMAVPQTGGTPGEDGAATPGSGSDRSGRELPVTPIQGTPSIR